VYAPVEQLRWSQAEISCVRTMISLAAASLELTVGTPMINRSLQVSSACLRQCARGGESTASVTSLPLLAGTRTLRTCVASESESGLAALLGATTALDQQHQQQQQQQLSLQTESLAMLLN
jgi:hypothetical protein